MQIFDLLLEPDLDFLSFLKHKTGWGVRYPGQGIFIPHPVLLTCHAICYLHNKKSNYSMELLHMKISDVLLEPDLDLFKIS